MIPPEYTPAEFQELLAAVREVIRIRREEGWAGYGHHIQSLDNLERVMHRLDAKRKAITT